MKTEHFFCECNSPSYQFLLTKFEADPKDESYEDELYLSVHLSQNLNFWNRLILGVKYIFGERQDFGHWMEIIIKSEDRQRLIEMLKPSPAEVPTDVPVKKVITDVVDMERVEEILTRPLFHVDPQEVENNSVDVDRVKEVLSQTIMTQPLSDR